MTAIVASLLGICEQCFAIFTIPSHVGPYAPHLSLGQGEGLFGVAWIAVDMFVGFGPGRS